LLWYYADMTENLTYQTDDDGTEILPVGEWFDEL